VLVFARQTKGKVMTDSNMKKFIALYLIPASVMADWAKTDSEIRKTAEQKNASRVGKMDDR
jgi:hypothetical protein